MTWGSVMTPRKWEPGIVALRHEWYSHNGEGYMCRYAHITTEACSPGPRTSDLWYDPKDPLQNDNVQFAGV